MTVRERREPGPREHGETEPRERGGSASGAATDPGPLPQPAPRAARGSSGGDRPVDMRGSTGGNPSTATPDPAAVTPAGSLRTSVILTTYNHPTLLEYALLGYARQTAQDFELIVADDGSGPETRAVIERLRPSLPYHLGHVWQPDTGFHKARAVNLAVLASRGAYLVFSDGDCIPAATFLESHLRAARPRRYVVGGFVRLSQAQSESIDADAVAAGVYERWVSVAQRLELIATHAKSLAYILANKRRKPKFYGLNFSVSRTDFYAVNGFDNTYHNCGREDSDLRNRMQLLGLRATSLWHRSGVFHQHHVPHHSRQGWRGVVEYYDRKDLAPESPAGLRELAAEAPDPGRDAGLCEGP